MLRVPVRLTVLILAAAAIGVTAGVAAPGSRERAPGEESVAAVLDELHAAASRADGERYFALFAPNAVFLGTDATERWSIDAFRAYATPRFETGVGWTYRVVERHVTIAAGGDVAWFDERLENEKYGACRGTGVLVDVGGDRRLAPGRGAADWRIAQYNLTIPIPNALAAGVVESIRHHAGDDEHAVD